MRKPSIFILLLCSIVALTSCDTHQNKNDEWENLLDTNLSKWNKYLSYKHKNSYDGNIPTDESGNIIEPIGLNNDPTEVFKIITENNELIFRVSGEIYGCIFTKQEYQNYHLKLKVKWGEDIYEPRLTKGKDSGLLYHSFGENGADYWRAWMFSHEFQVMRGRMGDYWTIGPTEMDIRAIPQEWVMNYIANEKYPFTSIRDTTKGYGFCSRSTDYESNEGEWTELELICFEDKSLHIVNGNVVMICENSSYLKDNVSVPLTKGKIQIQCEAAEVFYKDIKIKSINAIPEQYLYAYK